jgi:hypothetical protein
VLSIENSLLLFAIYKNKEVIMLWTIGITLVINEVFNSSIIQKKRRNLQQEPTQWI